MRVWEFVFGYFLFTIQSFFRRTEYCVGSGLELLSLLFFATVCQDSKCPVGSNSSFVNNHVIVKINRVVIIPCVVCNIWSICMIFKASHEFSFSGFERCSGCSNVTPTTVSARYLIYNISLFFYIGLCFGEGNTCSKVRVLFEPAGI